MAMEVYDAPPAGAMTAQTPKGDAPGPSAAGPGFGEMVGRRFVEAAKKTASLPIHTAKLAVGLESPENPMDYGLMVLAHAPLIAATGGAAQAVTGLRAAAPVARSLASGLISGGTAAVRGDENAVAQGMIGLGGAGLLEGGSSVLGRVLDRVAGPAARETARAAEGTRIGKDIGRVLPELETIDTGLYGAAKEWGRQQIEKVMQPAIAEISKRIGGGTAKWLDVPSLSSTRVNLQEALDGLFAAGKEARGKIRSEIIGELQRLDPQRIAGEIFDGALKARAAGHTYVTAISKGLTKDGILDPEKMRGYVNQNADKLAKFAGDYWPLVRRVLLGPGTPSPAPTKMLPEAGLLPSIPYLGKIKAPMGVARAAEAAQTGFPATAARSFADAAIKEPVPAALTLMGAAEAFPHFARRVFHRARGEESD